MLMALLSYSQELSVDKIIVQANLRNPAQKDTLLCWDLEKSRYIAKEIVRSTYCDSILMIQVEKIAYMDSIVIIQKEDIFVSKVIHDNDEQVRHLMNKTIFNLNTMLHESEEEVARQKRLKWFAIVGGGVVAAVLIAK